MANADEEGDPPLAVLRITVLGSSGCGKTSLVSAFVNNQVPTMHTRTDDPALFYKALSIKCSPKGPFIPILCEVEDTYGSDRTDGQDMYGHGRSVELFFSVRSHHAAPLHERAMFSLTSTPEGVIPFGGVYPPSEDVYMPIAHHRMGFILLVDLQNEDSLKHASTVYSSMKKAWSQRESNMPVVYLVGTKKDMCSNTLESQKVARRGKRFAEQEAIKWEEVSCFEFQKVRTVFRKMLVDIHSTDTLWKPGLTPRSDVSVDKTSSQPAQKCMQQ